MRLPLNRRHKCFLYLSLFLLVFGSTLLIVFNPLLEFIVDKSMVVAPGNKAFREWRKTRPLPMNVYFFNWTNPEDVYTPGVKAKFEEVGPYSFFHVREKVNVTFNDNNKTVTYQHFLSYVDDENSKGNLSDVITTVDMVAWVSFRKLRFGQKLHWIFGKLINSIPKINFKKFCRCVHWNF